MLKSQINISSSRNWMKTNVVQEHTWQQIKSLDTVHVLTLQPERSNQANRILEYTAMPLCSFAHDTSSWNPTPTQAAQTHCRATASLDRVPILCKEKGCAHWYFTIPLVTTKRHQIIKNCLSWVLTTQVNSRLAHVRFHPSLNLHFRIYLHRIVNA